MVQLVGSKADVEVLVIHAIPQVASQLSLTFMFIWFRKLDGAVTVVSVT